MENSQRWFLIAIFLSLAFVLPFVCLSYRTVDKESAEGHLLALIESGTSAEQEAAKTTLETIEGNGAVPLLNFGLSEPSDPCPRSGPRQLPTADCFADAIINNKFVPARFRGIYAREEFSRGEAVIVGIALPFTFLVAAIFLVLGRRKSSG